MDRSCWTNRQTAAARRFPAAGEPVGRRPGCTLVDLRYYSVSRLDRACATGWSRAASMKRLSWYQVLSAVSPPTDTRLAFRGEYLRGSGLISPRQLGTR